MDDGLWFNVHAGALANDASCDEDLTDVGGSIGDHTVVSCFLGHSRAIKGVFAEGVDGFAADALGAEGGLKELEMKRRLEADDE